MDDKKEIGIELQTYRAEETNINQDQKLQASSNFGRFNLNLNPKNSQNPVHKDLTKNNERGLTMCYYILKSLKKMDNLSCPFYSITDNTISEYRSCLKDIQTLSNNLAELIVDTRTKNSILKDLGGYKLELLDKFREQCAIKEFANTLADLKAIIDNLDHIETARPTQEHIILN